MAAEVDWQAVADAASGTADSPAVLAERFGVPESEVEWRLSELGVETCPGCGWWWQAMFLDVEGFCEDCQAKDDDDGAA